MGGGCYRQSGKSGPTIILELVMQWSDQHHCDCFKYSSSSFWGFQGGASAKEPACQCRRCKRNGFNPWVKKIPWKRAWQPSLVFLLGESSEQRSLADYSPWGCKELDTTEVTQHMHTIFSSRSVCSHFLRPVLGLVVCMSWLQSVIL